MNDLLVDKVRWSRDGADCITVFELFKIETTSLRFCLGFAVTICLLFVYLNDCEVVAYFYNSKSVRSLH